MKNEPYPRSTFSKENAGSRKDRQQRHKVSKKIASDKLALDLISKMIDFCIVLKDRVKSNLQ